MLKKLKQTGGMCLAVALFMGASGLQTAYGANPPPQAGSIGLQGTISAAAPTRAATISVPGNGAVFSSTPIIVSGLCPPNLLIKLFDNNVFVGSVLCTTGGSYSLQIDLFSGRNELVARDYDSLDQSGPDSNPAVTVTFNDAQFLQFGTHVSLSSAFAERGAPPGSELDWPITISGGNGPYAISVDWGDGTPTELISQNYPGTVIIKHTYKSAGVYQVLVKATDSNNSEAFLQLVGQATGAIQSQSDNKASDNSNNLGGRKIILWWPALAMLPLIVAAFWLGEGHKSYKMRHRRD